MEWVHDVEHSGLLWLWKSGQQRCWWLMRERKNCLSGGAEGAMLAAAEGREEERMPGWGDARASACWVRIELSLECGSEQPAGVVLEVAV